MIKAPGKHGYGAKTSPKNAKISAGYEVNERLERSTSRIRCDAGPHLIDNIRCHRNSFPERRLDAEPHGTDESGHHQRDGGLEGVTLRLLNAAAPPSQMLKVNAELDNGFDRARSLAFPTQQAGLRSRQRKRLKNSAQQIGKRSSGNRSARPGRWMNWMTSAIMAAPWIGQ